MRRSPVALVPLAVSVLIAACAGDRDTTAPRAIAPAQGASALSVPTVCSYSQMRADARRFFTRSNDIVFTYIGDAAQASDPTTNLWRVINRIAEARLTSDQALQWAATAIYGELTTTDAFGCMPGGVGDVSSVPDGALASAIYAGIFEVRGGGFATSPAFGYLEVGGAKVHSFPRYGVEHNPVGTQWSANPFLVVGVPTQYGPNVPSPNDINTNGQRKDGFELYSIPSTQSKAGDVIGVCVLAVATANGAANMLVHSGKIEEHIAPTQICDPQYGALSSPSLFASLARRTVSLFAPKLAFGDELDGTDYSGGGPTSWSPNVIGTVVASNVQLAFTAQSPTNANIGDNVHFEVTATINGQTVPDVDVTLSIYGNNGTPGTLVGTTTVPTDGNGVATFNLSFTKAGGYYIQATGTLAGFPTGSALSQQLWIKNQ